MGPDMSLKSVQFTITFMAVSMGAFVRFIGHMDLWMASEMSFADKSFLATGALEWFIIGLDKKS